MLRPAGGAGAGADGAGAGGAAAARDAPLLELLSRCEASDDPPGGGGGGGALGAGAGHPWAFEEVFCAAYATLDACAAPPPRPPVLPTAPPPIAWASVARPLAAAPLLPFPLPLALLYGGNSCPLAAAPLAAPQRVAGWRRRAPPQPCPDVRPNVWAQASLSSPPSASSSSTRRSSGSAPGAIRAPRFVRRLRHPRPPPRRLTNRAGPPWDQPPPPTVLSGHAASLPPVLIGHVASIVPR
jgi:hypothetical protein